MPINELYHTWMQRICELRPGQRITQVCGFVWLIVGIHLSRSGYLSRIAGKILVTAKAAHYRRIQSFGDMVLTERGFPTEIAQFQLGDLAFKVQYSQFTYSSALVKML